MKLKILERNGEPKGEGTEQAVRWPDLSGAWTKLSKEFRLAFLSALLIGFVVHLYVFSNLIINHDGAVSVISWNEHLTSGRWSLAFFSRLSWIYETPVVIALLVILALAWTAGLTVRILEIKNPACVVLTSAFLVSFPSICCIFPYLYTADAYLFALLLNAAGVALFKRYKFGWIAAIFLMAVSVGIYQSFICFSVGLLLFDCMLALFSEESVKNVLKRGGMALLTIGAALVLYRLLLEFFLWKNGVSLSDYRGMADAANSGVMDYLRALPLTYREFFLFFWRTSFLPRRLLLLQRFLLVFGAGCGVYLIAAYKLYKKPVRLCLLLLGAGLMPAALNLICVIAAGKTDTNILMHYSFVLVYVFLLKIFEMTVSHAARAWKRKTWKAPAAVALCLCAVLTWHNFCVTNTAYLRVQLVYENSYALANRIMTRLESMEGYTPDTPILLAGTAASGFGNKVSFPELAEFSGQQTTLLNEYCGTLFIRQFLGASKLCATEEQRLKVLESGVLDTMPAYPAEGSIRWYDGIILIQLGGYSNLQAFPG